MKTDRFSTAYITLVWAGSFIASVAVLRLALSDRSDYAGHFAAGFGATMLILAVSLALARKPLGWIAVGVLFTAIALGAMAEQTAFRLAIFDPVDFATQSLGACLACACVMRQKPSIHLAILVVIIGFITLGIGSHYAFA